MLEALFSGLISGATARNSAKPHPIARLQGAASAFLAIERHKLERAVYISGVTLINAFAFVLIAIVGLTMLLVGLALWLEPTMGQGPAFALIGGITCLAALAGGYMVHRLVLHPGDEQHPPV